MIQYDTNDRSVLSRAKFAFITTVPSHLQFHLSSRIKYLIKNGAEVTVISSFSKEISMEKQMLIDMPHSIKYGSINIPRKIELYKDIQALIKLIVFFSKNRFDVVHSGTPKAGLLCAIAAKICFIRIRLHTFTGQPWVTQKGLSRFLMRFSDKLILKLSTHCYADSLSQKEFLITEKIATETNISVIGNGSVSGVDMSRFNSALFGLSSVKSIKEDLKINHNDFVITFIGRLTRDKGIYELLTAFDSLNRKYRHVKLLLIGPLDDKKDEEILSIANDTNNVILLGLQNQPEKYLSVSSLLCLPSYREGFGSVVIEAAAMGVPAIGSDIVGLRDAIVHKNTGLLIKPKSSLSLYEAFVFFIENPLLLKQYGINARKRCKEEFDSNSVNENIASVYAQLLSKLE